MIHKKGSANIKSPQIIIFKIKRMAEKNYDPDNDNCPEKDTIENLHNSKLNNNSQTTVEFIDDSPNRISKKDKDKEQKTDSGKPEDN